MNDSAYIDKDELMRIAPIKKTKAYEIIRIVNSELMKMGKIVIRGKAPRNYTLFKLGIKNPADLGNLQD